MTTRIWDVLQMFIHVFMFICLYFYAYKCLCITMFMRHYTALPCEGRSANVNTQYIIINHTAYKCLQWSVLSRDLLVLFPEVKKTWRKGIFEKEEDSTFRRFSFNRLASISSTFLKKLSKTSELKCVSAKWAVSVLSVGAFGLQPGGVAG